MIYLQISMLWLVLSSVLCDLPRGTKRNTYLPPEPTKGYKYDKPPIPFPKPTPGYPRPSTYPDVTRPGVTPTRPFPGPPPTRPSTGPTPGYPRPRPTPGQPPDGHDHHHHEPGMPFDFNYAVKEDAFGNDYSHNAISDGDIVRGEYRVQLPDGRTQVVRYTADWKHGFSAQVSYDGAPRFDLPRPGGNFQGY